MFRKFPLAGFVVGFCSLLAACEQTVITPIPAASDKAILEAISTFGLGHGDLSVPKIDKPMSLPARLKLVDTMMQDPLQLPQFAKSLTSANAKLEMSAYLEHILRQLFGELPSLCSDQRQDVFPGNEEFKEMPLPLRQVVEHIVSVHGCVSALEWPARETVIPVVTFLETAVPSRNGHIISRLVSPNQYMPKTTDFDVERIAAGLFELSLYLEAKLPSLIAAIDKDVLGEWETSYGRVRVAGASDDRHSGDYLLLIETGGNDVYDNMNPTITPGSLSVIIDLSGNDQVRWDKTPGPGAGLLGLDIWMDLSGDDQYTGRNYGLGTGLFGAGLLWDRGGDDLYKSGSMSQGAAQYGIGVMIDDAGNDRYVAELASQGFGGPGGYGVQVDRSGDDYYECGNVVPDRVAARNQRHGGVHYFSLCQGYGYGMRPVISGGVGVLLELAGDDKYQADMFAQGAATWFGLGVLTDVAGDDEYLAYEHCQGEALHAGAGFLGDWSGNDRYTGHEHCQGVGVDRSIGLLVDELGDDVYRANHESQGTGVKPFGIGLIVEHSGNDTYEAASNAQGYSLLPPGFPGVQRPLGVLIDLHGSDEYLYPLLEQPNAKGRVQAYRGLAIDR